MAIRHKIIRLGNTTVSTKTRVCCNNNGSETYHQAVQRACINISDAMSLRRYPHHIGKSGPCIK